MKVSLVIGDMRMPAELRDELFKAIVRPAVTHGSECWAVKEKEESILISAEMSMVKMSKMNDQVGPHYTSWRQGGGTYKAP